MAEKLTLTTPVVDHEIIGLQMSWTLQQVVIVWKNSLGHAHSLLIQGPPAVTMMRQINKADFTTKSLQRQLMEKLVTDGVLVGTISGTPE